MEFEKHQYIDRLKELGANMSCMCCGCKDMYLLIHDVDDIKNQKVMGFSILHVGDGCGDISTRSLEVSLSVCPDCGFVKMHSLAKVSKNQI